MSEFENSVEQSKDKALSVLREWKKEESAKEIQRKYLSSQGIKYKDRSKLEELLDERHNLALCAEDENVRLKAIDSSIAMAAGSEKITNVQNNQYNFGEFLNSIK